MRQLLDLATLLVLDPFERTRPLWQFVVVEGLRGGKAALVQKMHHTITDGEGGVQMSLQYLDFTATRPIRRRPSPATIGRRRPPAPLDDATASRDLLLGGWRLPIGIARQVSELLADPAAIPAAERGDDRDRARRPDPALRRRAGARRRCGPSAR